MKILIFAGTTEGRKLAEILAASGIESDVCVATSYGEQVMGENDRIRILCGRLDKEGMKSLYDRENYGAVVDATHPFATVVSETVKDSLEGSSIPYLRLSRSVNEKGSMSAGEVVKSVENSSSICFYDTVSECADALKEYDGNILLTTGSKDLPEFACHSDVAGRLFVRVIPGVESINICSDNGISGRQIIAMQGPFSVDMNVATIKQYDIKHIVTKESGRAGGYDEKIEAAALTGIRCHIIRRPDAYAIETGMDMEQVLEKISLITGKNIKRSPLDIILCGAGCGDLGTMTDDVRNCIEKADYIFGAKRLTESIDRINSNAVVLSYYRAEDIIPEIERIYREETGASQIVVLFSGDTGFCSGCVSLFSQLKDIKYAQTRIMPGISSIQYMAAKCGVSWEDANILSIHGKSQDDCIGVIYDSILHNSKTIFITSGAADIRRVYDFVTEGHIDINAISYMAGRNLSYDDEIIYELVKQGSTECDIEDTGLYVGIILNGSPVKRILTPYMDDSDFLRDKVPMTKEDIRRLSVCKMKLNSTSVVYDIGSGTGSVTVEMAGLSPDIRVYAVECNEAALKLTRDNVRKHFRHNVSIIEGTAPEALSMLPKATHAFIGGSRGNLRSIIDELSAINPNMRIVMNAVSLESIGLMNEIIKEIRVKDLDIVQVSVSRVKQVGSYSMMDADNPVHIFSFTLDN